MIDRRRRDVSNVVVSCMKELGTLSQHLAAAAVVITLARSDLGHSPCVAGGIWLDERGGRFIGGGGACVYTRARTHTYTHTHELIIVEGLLSSVASYLGDRGPREGNI